MLKALDPPSRGVAARRPQGSLTHLLDASEWVISLAPLAPVAQLDRVLPSEGRGRRFESYRVRHCQKFNEIRP